MAISPKVPVLFHKVLSNISKKFNQFFDYTFGLK